MVQVRRGFKTWCENASRGYRREMGIDPCAALDPRLLAQKLNVVIWPVGDIPGLDEQHVARLTVTERDAWSAATIRDGDKSLIIVNEGHSLSRQNNSICHELGHIELRHVAPKMMMLGDGLMMMADYDPVMEEEATIFAGAILAPREALLKWISQGLSTAELANYFGVSSKLIEMRKHITGIGFQLARRQRGTWVP